MSSVSGIGVYDPAEMIYNLVAQSHAVAYHGKRPIVDVPYRDLSETREGVIASILSGAEVIKGVSGEDGLGSRVDVRA